MDIGIIADTSVIISFLRGKNKISDNLLILLQKNQVVTTGIIIAELLQGIKNTKEENRIITLISSLPTLEITTDIWLTTGKLSLSLRKKGINIPLTDVAIASLAIENNLQIFTIDKHFELIPGVRIYDYDEIEI